MFETTRRNFLKNSALVAASASLGQSFIADAFAADPLKIWTIGVAKVTKTWEEMGISPNTVDVLGNLDGVLTRTNYLVFPVVGVIPHPYEFDTKSKEVEEIIEIPLHSLMDDEVLRYEARLNPDGSLLKRVAFAHEKYLVFGATAWILRPGEETQWTIWSSSS